MAYKNKKRNGNYDLKYTKRTKSMEKKDAMITSNFSAPSNLPQENIIEMYSNPYQGERGSYKSGTQAINNQITHDIKKMFNRSK